MRSDVACFSILAALWAGLNIADAFWQYYYVQAVVNPNPRTAVNRTSSGFNGYEAMMYLFGAILGIMNAALTGLGLRLSYHMALGGDEYFIRRLKSPWMRRILIATALLIQLPVSLFVTLLPPFGGLIVKPIVRDVYWKHRCDSYQMYAILDGKAYDAPAYLPNLVYFYDTRTNRFLYTYELTNPEGGERWSFQLRNWAADQASIAQTEYPTLQNIEYDFSSHTLTGNCTLPMGNGTTTRECVEGTFDPGDHLAFNLTSYVPFNTTSISIPPLSLLNTTTDLKIEDSAWTYPDASPAFVLRTVNTTTGQLGQVVLHTTVRNPNDCTELKVCLSGVPDTDGTAGLVGAEVMVPMGIALFGEAQHAVECTTPDDDDD